MPKSFSEVFKKIPISQKTLELLKDSKVSNIKINKSSNNMNIFIENNSIISDNYFNEVKEKLYLKFPFVKEISFHISYNLNESNPKIIIENYWNVFLKDIEKKSPICYKILSNGKLEINENNLNLEITKNSAFLLISRNIDKELEQKLNDNFNIKTKVNFIEEKTENSAKKALDEENILKKIISERPIITNESGFESRTSFKSNKKTGARKKTRVNEELSGTFSKIADSLSEDAEVLIHGLIFDAETRETKSGKYLTIFDISDKSSSVTVKFFCKKEEFVLFAPLIKKGSNIAVKGKVNFDDFSKELVVMALQLSSFNELEKREDNSPEKRVELHLHTQMSSMDGINPIKDYINRALKWGHKAIAVTDHGVVQAFPSAMEASSEKDIKIIYGTEAYLVDDLGAVVQCERNQSLLDTFVVFDFETTGLSKDKNKITEIGAVKIKNLEIIDSFSSFVNPETPISAEITKLTGIKDEDVINAPKEQEIIPKFKEFIDDAVLVAHNASFDIGFLSVAVKRLNLDINNTVLDTLELSRTLFPKLSRYKLNIVAEHLNISLENHHRAVDDSKATAEIFIKCAKILKEKSITTLKGINLLAAESIDKKKLKAYHAIILVQNQIGLKNLYELISKSHINYFFKRPRIPKSEYIELKEGLIIGTACEAGEFYKAVLENKPEDYIRSLAEFYDYFEIQPIQNNMYLLREGIVNSIEELQEINKKIVSLGEKFNKLVVATCDVHFLEPEDEVYRRIIMTGEGFKDADNQPPLFFRTTEEMLAEFSYLGEKKAKEVVIYNTQKIANMTDKIKPIPDETFPPFIEGAEEKLKKITTDKAKETYGENLPTIVKERLEKELDSIIKNGFSVMYIIAQELVWKSLEDGYLVGSRGSVGSSFAATMAGITEVNPLPPHYLCKNCKFTDFDSETVKEFAGASGCDMPDKICPNCSNTLHKDGHDIPFETFLGFDGDKEPDIDLNFSGEYQSTAHAYTEFLFGKENVFKAGTIGTLADKTAYGYVIKYMEEKNINPRRAEINRLKVGCTGIKRTTGQHPGGLMILPKGHSIYEFCPVQRPANDMKSDVVTTHFDYHSISGRLLKLDLLGHDVPTIIRMLHDITGIDPRTVDIGDKEIMSLFNSTKALKIEPADINCKTGTLGLPEFGTNFVRTMLMDTVPSSFSELVRISGLSHGTDVWLNNAQDLVKSKIATLKEIIPTRDDIMVYLINKGVERKASFKIMENVRKGKGLTSDEEETMKNSNVPEWYIESCKKIKYMFPKGHAVAYVMMSVRIGYFKIHYPYAFYAASFSVKSEDFNYDIMCLGKDIVITEIRRITELGRDASAKEKNMLSLLELVLEMYVRGLKFSKLDLYNSEVSKFRVLENGLLPPLCSIEGLGDSVAQNIIESRKNGEFLTIEDFKERTKSNKKVIELLKKNHILDGIPETNQLSLF